MNATKTATPGCASECLNLEFETGRKHEEPAVEIQVRGGSARKREPYENLSESNTGHPGGGWHWDSVQTAIAVLALAAVGCGGYFWWTHARLWAKTDNAYVAAQIHQISSRVVGTVQEVLVKDNQVVRRGEVLARLDRADFELRRNQAQAQVAQARAQSQQAEAQIAQATAQMAQQQAREIKAQQDLQRAESLFNRSSAAISKQELDAAQAEYDASRAAVRAAESALASSRAIAAAAQAQEQVAGTSLQDAELQLSYTELRAPTAGCVGRKNLEVGNHVQAGQALLALVEPQAWIIANFKETQLAEMRPGQLVSLRIDAFPGHVFAGRVDSIAPASGAQFALLPPDNATGNFTKIVQRIPVKITLDTGSMGEFAERIAAGMSVIVEVKVR